VFISLTSLVVVVVVVVVVVYMQDLGQNFVDPLPVDDLPSMVKARENLARASSTSKSQATTILPGASIIETVPYIEYVPRPVPQAPRSSKRT
jgi:hypothetical protein